MDIKVTETAKSKLYDMGVSDNVFLRIGVRSGGCSGNTYDAVLDQTMSEVDEVYYTEAQMEQAKKLAEDDPESSKKIKAAFDSLASDFTRNERAALAFTIIENLRENREK